MERQASPSSAFGGWRVAEPSEIHAPLCGATLSLWPRSPPGEIETPVLEHHVACLQLADTQASSWTNGRLRYQGGAPRGGLQLHQPGERVRAAGNRPVEMARLILPAPAFRRALADLEIAPDAIELRDPNFAADLRLLTMVGFARDALRVGGPLDRLFADHLGLAIFAHLLAEHSSLAGRDTWPKARASRAMPPRELNRVFEYVHDRLDQEISLADLAGVAGLSAAHFARVFKQATGLPPYKYLLRLRVERAKQLLATSDRPIAEIAFDCGFCHQEHLTTSFRRLIGTTPSAYRRSTQ